MKQKTKISLSKYKVARLNFIFGGDGGGQTQQTTSKIIILCPKPGEKSKDGGMGCPNSPQLSHADTSPCS